jgi:putative DNA primase/helicase
VTQAERKRSARRQAEQEMFESTAKRLSADLRGLSGVETTAYHKAKQIEPTPGAPARNGDLLVPGYDADGKLWTVQYIKEHGTKRFAKESRKRGCFHVGGAPNGDAACRK